MALAPVVFSRLYTDMRILTIYTLSRIKYPYTTKRINCQNRLPIAKQVARTGKQAGAVIRRERRKQGLTQAELGDKVGLRQATISKLEKGESATQLQTLLDALTALDLQVVITERKTSSKEDIESLF